MSEKKHPVGRPTKYTKELAEEICETIASSSKGLTRLCKENKNWPNRSNIMKWLRKYPEFRDLYTKSKQDQVDVFVDEILEIADDTSNDTLIRIDKNGEEQEICNSEWINRSRLRVDTRKWLAAKLCPRVYGERAIKEHVSEDAKSLIERIIDKL